MTGVGIELAAARREVGLRQTNIPWHVREELIDIAASLSRHCSTKYGDDDLGHLNSRTVDEAWVAEYVMLGRETDSNDPISWTAFRRGATNLMRYAVSQGWVSRVEPEMVGIDRLSILVTPEPTMAPVLSKTDTVMLHDLDGTPIGLVNVYVVGTTGQGRGAS